MKIMLVIPNHFHPISKTLTWEALISDLLKKHSEYIKLIYRIISKIYKVSIIVQRILKKNNQSTWNSRTMQLLAKVMNNKTSLSF